MATPKQDNTTYHHKVTLRRQAVDLLHDEWGLADPVVMETHGGEGHLFDACYSHLEDGVVFEQDPTKINTLAKQRPTWAVYEADCVETLAEGAGAHVVVDLLDLDPYGAPWDVMEAFFSSGREFAERMIVVVNDGLRIKLATGSGWEVKQLEPMVRQYGNDLHPIYLQICEEMVTRLVKPAGYVVESFAGYHCGHSLAMTHYMAVLKHG